MGDRAQGTRLLRGPSNVLDNIQFPSGMLVYDESLITVRLGDGGRSGGVQLVTLPMLNSRLAEMATGGAAAGGIDGGFAGGGVGGIGDGGTSQGIRLRRITEAAYNALEQKRNDTLYLITPNYFLIQDIFLSLEVPALLNAQVIRAS